MGQAMSDGPTPAEYFLSKRIAEVLMAHYPGHLWGVHVNRSVVNIKNMSLSGSHGYVLHIQKFRTEDDFNRGVINAGGEILERFAVSRGRMRLDEITNLQRDFAKRPVFDGC